MKRGFTLIELLTVVIIIGVLSSIAVPQYRRSLERSRLAEAQEMLPAIYDSWVRYKVEHGTTLKNINFDLLDITMKGKKDGYTWKTANYTYGTTSPNGSDVIFKATVRKGKYQGTIILYDGQEFTCVNNDSHPDGCEVFNVAVQENYVEYAFY